jgi:hypothetical protein
VGAGGKTLRRGIAVLACAVIAGAVTGRAAAQGTSPRPEPSPPRAHAPIQPEAAPSAPAPQSASKSASTGGVASTPYSGSSATYSPPQTTVVVTKFRTRTIVKRDAATAKKADPPPPKVSSKPLRELMVWNQGREVLETSARGLAAAPSSRESLLLLLVGLALVVLVLGETTFLRRAARNSVPQRVGEESLPIRRVQLRR